MKIRKGDMVQVLVGDDKSDTPHKVIEVVDDGKRVRIEGVNRAYKHVKKGHKRSPTGGRLSIEMPVAVSNVALYCQKCGKGVRVGFRYAADGSKVRVCKKCNSDLGQVSPARKAYAKK
jgi:large subunit ribosomal protein L24